MRHKKLRFLFSSFVFMFVFFAFVCKASLNFHTAPKKHTYIENEIVLVFNQSTTPQEQTELISKTTPDASIIDQDNNYILIQIADGTKQADMIKAYSKSELITCAEPNYIVSTSALTKDKYSSSQWALSNPGSYQSYVNSKHVNTNSKKGIDLNISDAWNSYQSSDREVIVAVIDTGVDITHEDLASNIWINEKEIPGDGIDNDDNGYVDDVNGWDFYNNDSSVCHYKYKKSSKSYTVDKDDNDNHGTHCAGIIAAVANNKVGIAGVASNINIKIMPLKIEGGTNGQGSLFSAVKAIHYAQNMGAKVCNISWATSTYSASLKQAIKESSMLFVAAAGNSGTDNNEAPVYPASFGLDNLISVTFVNANGKLMTTSNYGVNAVDIAAPGYDIMSTIVGNKYASMSGSSMAAPHVSAIAAILYSTHDSLYPANIKEVILSNITALPSLEDRVTYAGIPNLTAIIDSLDMLTPDTKKPSLELSTSYTNKKIELQIKSSDKGGSKIRVIKYLFGKQSLDTFQHGTIGTSVTKKKITLPKAGTYTFYISDYAGNEKKIIHKVKQKD